MMTMMTMKTSERRPWVARIGIFCVLVGAMVSCGDSGGPGCHDLGGSGGPMLCKHHWRCDGVDYEYEVMWDSIGSRYYTVRCGVGDAGAYHSAQAPESWQAGPSVCEAPAAEVAEMMCGWFTMAQ